jgi:mannose-6-phosphate isomerase-like protein (cupin superfamily)
VNVDPGRVQVLGPNGPGLPLVDGEGTAWALVGAGMGARMRSLNLIRLGEAACTREQRHDDEAVYFAISGDGSVEDLEGGAWPLEKGAMAHVAPGVRYRIVGGGDGLELVGGPSLIGADGTGDGIRIFHRDRPDVLLPMIASDARLVVWLGCGSRNANMNYVRMQPGEANVPHTHEESEDTIYILSGEGTVEDLTHGLALRFGSRQAIQVPPGVRHRVKADRGTCVESVGGPCPADVAMLSKAGVLPAEQA